MKRVLVWCFVLLKFGLTTQAQVLSINQPFRDILRCADTTGINLVYTVSDTSYFLSGNIFTVQVSDSNGSFATPFNIGSKAATKSGFIRYIFPRSMPSGHHYRLRIVSSKPQVISPDDGVDISYYSGLMSSYVTISNQPGLIHYSSNNGYINWADTVCAGTPITFTAHTLNTTSAIIIWKVNYTTVDSGNTYTYVDTDIFRYYFISCAFILNSNCGDYITGSTIYLTAIPQIVSGIIISASVNNPICARTPVTFHATVTNGDSTSSYQWMKNGVPLAGASKAVYTDSSLQPGDIITCAGTSNLRCAAPTISAPIALTIYPIPDSTIIASGPVHVCNTDSVILQAPAASSYQWQLNGTNIAGATTPNYIVHSTGNYTVYVVNNFGCYTTSTTISATVSPAPNASISNIGGYLKICSNDSVLLGPTFGSNANYTYQWMNNGANIYGATNAYYAATGAGNYSAVISNNGCMRTSNVLTTTTVAAPVDSLLMYGHTVLCPGVAGILLSADTSAGLPYSYTWLMNNAMINGATSATYFATIPTVYSLKITDTATGCSIVTRPVNVVQSAGPIPVVIYKYPSLGTGVFNSYQWYLNGSVITNATSATIQPTHSGAYAVGVMDSNGCTGMSANYYFTYSGVSVVAKENIHIYPNPANEVVFIDAPAAINAAVYSMDGRLMFTGSDVKKIDIAGWASGVYLIKILDGGSVVRIDKLVKN